MERDERDLRISVAQAADEVRADIDCHGLVAQPLEGVLDPGTGAQRHLAFQ